MPGAARRGSARGAAPLLSPPAVPLPSPWARPFCVIIGSNEGVEGAWAADTCAAGHLSNLPGGQDGRTCSGHVGYAGEGRLAEKP